MTDNLFACTQIDDTTINVNSDGVPVTQVNCGNTLVYNLALPDIVCPPNQSWTTSQTIAPIMPTNNGGALPTGAYSISPALPAGTSFNSNTGEISGTPTTPQATTTYTITATNQSGSDSCTFTITVVLALQPPNITCPPNQSWTTGTTITPIGASNSGGAIPSGGWSISPSAPAGTTFNTNTGQLTGTPITPQGATTYTITASNAAGNDSCTFSIVITAALQPPNITCPPNQSWTTGTTITPITPSNSGGTIPSGGWSISPSVPAGTSFNSNTGQITGTPTTSQGSTTYTITATNAAGNDSCTFNITIAAALQPPNITCPPNQTFTTGTAITPIAPTNTGGAIPSGGYSISPSVPAGLSFNSNTGQITGTPTTTQSGVTYTITATNAAGSDSCTFTITVNASLQPPNITCPPNQTFTAGTTITPIAPSNTGGMASSYSISPSLPVGLSFNTSTGQITGTPSATQSVTTYTITATNAAGSDSCTFNITVNAGLQPPNIVCPPNQTFTAGTAITPIAPSNSGGAIPSGGYSISPALPAGLSFNSNTGQVTGTPTSATANATYTITATNAAGSDSCAFNILVNAATPMPSPTTGSNQCNNNIFSTVLGPPLMWEWRTGYSGGTFFIYAQHNGPGSGTVNVPLSVTMPAGMEARIVYKFKNATNGEACSGDLSSGTTGSVTTAWGASVPTIIQSETTGTFIVGYSVATLEIREIGTTTPVYTYTVSFENEQS